MAKRSTPLVMLTLTVAVASCFSRSTWAFDPLSAVAVVKEGAQALSAISDTASEITGTIDAFQDLYGEFDSSQQVSNEGMRTVRLIQEIESLGREAGYTKDEISALTGNRDVTSLQSTLRTLTRIVRTGKNIGRLLSKLERKAQLAEIENTELERQQLAIQKQILDSIVQTELARKRDEIKARVEWEKWIKENTNNIRKNGGFRWGKIGVYSFPNVAKTLKKAIETQKSIIPYLVILLLPIFLFRTIYLQVSMSPEEKYDALLRDVVLTLFFFSVIPFVVEAVFGASDAIANLIHSRIQPSISHPPEMPKGSIMKFQQWLDWAWEVIKNSLFWITSMLFNIGIAFYLVIFPIVILLAKMQGSQLPLTIFFFTFVLLNLWPVFWNLVGLLAINLWDPATLADQSSGAALVFSILQFIAPFIAMKALHVVSPTDAAVSIIKAATGVPAMGGGVVNGLTTPISAHSEGRPSAMGALNRFQKASGSERVGMLARTGVIAGASAGKASSFLASQTLSRTTAGLTRAKNHARLIDRSPGAVIKAGLSGVVSNQSSPLRVPTELGTGKRKS